MIMKTTSTSRISTLVVVILGLIFCETAIGTAASLRGNGMLAFTSNRDGNREIYVMNADGTDQRRLTSNSIVDDHAVWSPDGKRIAFLSQRPTGAFAIFLMNADGTDKTEVTPVNYQSASSFPYDFWQMSWSPDGLQIVFQDRATPFGQYDLFIVNVDGSNRRFLISGGQPDWSPDGSKILFTGGGLYTIKPDGTDLRPITHSGGEPTWSADADRIVFRLVDGANWEDLISVKADGTGYHTFANGCIDFNLCGGLGSPDWSPDGNKIVFFLDGYASNGDRELWVKDVSGSGQRQLTNSVGNNVNPSWQAQSDAAFDFDGDGRGDVSVFRPSDRVWYLDRSTNGFSATQFGLSTDKITPADYDGDGKTDISVYRDGTWYWLNSSDNSFSVRQFGIASDIPVPADYEGNRGLSELAVYRDGTWWVLNRSTNQVATIQFGLATDKPVPADYDGDGRDDQAIFRNGEWHLNRSTQGYGVVSWGLATDTPVPADYDGDGKTDPAVYRDGTWYLLQSLHGWGEFRWGIASDIPAPADYDGDGKTDAAVYRNGTWYVNRSTGGVSIQQFGLMDDMPLSSAYRP